MSIGCGVLRRWGVCIGVLWPKIGMVWGMVWAAQMGVVVVFSGLGGGGVGGGVGGEGHLGRWYFGWFFTQVSIEISHQEEMILKLCFLLAVFEEFHRMFTRDWV